jgi:hypothetical protein
VGYEELHKILPGTTLDKRTCLDFWSIGDKPRSRTDGHDENVQEREQEEDADRAVGMQLT